MNLLNEGLTIMTIGITFVLTFLCILIFAMNIMSKIVGYLNKLFPEEIIKIESKSKKTSNDDEAVALALAVIKSRN